MLINDTASTYAASRRTLDRFAAKMLRHETASGERGRNTFEPDDHCYDAEDLDELDEALARLEDAVPHPHIEARTAAFADLVATAIANAATRAELIASRARIVAAADGARRRIERDLHDEVQQRLVALGLELRAVGSACAGRTAAAQGADFSPCDNRGRGLGGGAGAISRGIHPAILSRGGLGPALQGAGPPFRGSG